jgi:hypothetical protein
MYNVSNLLCVGLLYVVCYMKPLYCVCVESCPSNQIIYVHKYLCYFMHMFALSQRLMVLHMSFLFRGYSCSYHVIHMACTKVKSIMLRKKTKKLHFTVFFDHLCAGRFTVFGIGLPVVPIGKSVIPTGIPVFCFSILKFQFGPIFDQFYQFSQ